MATPESLPQIQSGRWIVFLVLLACAGGAARADVGLLLEQPIGRLGAISSSGHSAIYLSRVCAASPTRLRRCQPGENGVVISSFGRVDPYFWTAIPLLPYLYAVENPEEIPRSVDAATVLRLRDRYRRVHLESVAPDGPGGAVPRGHWDQLVGGAYDRKVYIFELPTTPAQDDQFIKKLNATRNSSAEYSLFFHNCANFAAFVLNFYYPHSVRRSFIADLGLMTPKHTAKSMVSYAHHHPNLRFSTFIIPQVRSEIHRSGHVYGVLEALLKKKQYVIPLAIWQPYLAVAMAGAYLARGRFNPARHAIMLNGSDTAEALLRDPNPPALPKPRPPDIVTAYIPTRPNPPPSRVDYDCAIPFQVPMENTLLSR